MMFILWFAKFNNNLNKFYKRSTQIFKKFYVYKIKKLLKEYKDLKEIKFLIIQ